MNREKVIKGLELVKQDICEMFVSGSQIAVDCLGIDNAIELLKEQESVVAYWDDNTGHWIEGDRNGIDPHTRTTGEMIDTFRCSWCGFYQYWKTPFCPNCGVKMEGR